MDQNVQIKLEWDNSLRRTSVLRTETLIGVRRVVSKLLGLDESSPLDLTYKDEEGDTINVGSDLEMRQLLDEAAASKKTLRFSVVAARDYVPEAPTEEDFQEDESPDRVEEESEEEEEAPTGPEFPFAHVARALSDRETVGRVLGVLQNEAIASTVTSFASAYVASEGNQAAAGMAVLPQVPALMGMVADLVEEVPVLKDLQDLLVTSLASCCAAAATPPVAEEACGESSKKHCHPHHHHDGRRGCRPGGHQHGRCHPHHGGGGGHHHRGHHHGGPHSYRGRPHGPAAAAPGCPMFRGAEPDPLRGQAHFGVFCDGCASDEKLKQQSQEAGHVSRRGFLRGQRYKSHTIVDFDLCEACHANIERFPEAVYGPFAVIAPPTGPQRWGWRGAGHPGPWRRGCGPNAAPEVPLAEEAKDKDDEPWKGLMGAFKQAMSQGAQAFSQAAAEAQGEGGELAEIARAISESLKESKGARQPEAKQTSPSVAQETDAKASEKGDLFTKWAQQLRQLETLGFDKSETYLEFLEEEKGDLERVINRIVRRDL